MAPLEGETLGQRHRSLNRLTNETISKNTPFQEIENLPELSDANRLYKIDVAGKYRNIAYILSNLKSDDDLYVSRALKRSTWLIQDPQYSEIINPEYLEKELFPSMTTRAVAKLSRHIRLHLKDEKRAELFYKHLDKNDKKTEALKWLPICSAAFIEERIQIDWDKIELTLFKRLCEKSVKVFEVMVKKRHNDYRQSSYYEAAMFLLNTHMDVFLKAFEESAKYSRPSFKKHATKLILSKCPERILENLENYIKNIDLGEFGKHLGPEGTKKMILKLGKLKSLRGWFNYNHMKPLVNKLPREGKFEFVKSVFVDKTALEEENDEKVEMLHALADVRMCSLKSAGRLTVSNTYQWYHMAPFSTAFVDLKKLIRTESSPDERTAMLKVLITSAGKNMENIHTLLHFFREKHINEPERFRTSFVHSLLSNTDAYAYDERSWKLVEEILHSLELFTNEDNNYELNPAVQAVVSYYVLHDKPIPELILKKFMDNFSTFGKLEKKLNENRKIKIFNFLRSELQKKLETKSVKDKNDIPDILSILRDILGLLKDWKKDLDADAMKTVNELIENKQVDQDLSIVYNIEKKWRRSLFEQSLDLSQAEEVYMNAMKHNPPMLLQKRVALDKILKTDSIDLIRILRKIRVYFPDNIGAQWLNMYEEKLNVCRTERAGYKAVTRGICILMDRDKFTNLLQAYVPENYKIQWSEDDAAMVNLRKYLAQQMYLVRPTLHVDAVLLFSKGDYLQYALPSLTSVCHRKSQEECRKFLPKLLDGAVSLQKHGIRLAFAKLESKELSETFTNMWNTTKNASIRAVVFNLTFDLLRREKNDKKIHELWSLLKTFMQKLTTEENRTIYATIANVNKVPKVVRAEFCVMSYKLLKSLPAKLNCDSLADGLLHEMAAVMDTIDEDFVTEILQKYINETYLQKKILQDADSSVGNEHQVTTLITNYIMYCRSEEVQARRFEKVLKTITEQSVLMWNDVYKKSLKPRNIFVSQLDYIIRETKTLFEDRNPKFVNPIGIFKSIQELTNKLPVEENYVFLTNVKVAIAYCESYATVCSGITSGGEAMEVDEETSEGQEQKHRKMVSSVLAPEFSKLCLVMLNQDLEQYFPSIRSIFADCLLKFLGQLYNDTDMFKVHILKSFTADPNNISAFFVALIMYPNYIAHCDEDLKNAFLEIRKRFVVNTNREIKLCYYAMLSNDENFAVPL